MSAPTLPTIDELVEEGLAKAKNSNPSNAKLARAKDVWMEEIKSDIAAIAKRSRFLQITSHGVLTIGQSRYSNPTDFGHDLSLVLLDGTITGTAQSGSSSTLTLAADVSIDESDILGRDILITGGTGAGSLSQCTAYNSSTKVATVTPDFRTAPAASSTYMVVSREWVVEPSHVGKTDIEKTIARDRPTTFSQIGDEDYGEFVFNCPPDRAYGARLRYYADIGRLDLTGTHIQTLYFKWRNLWTLGIKYKELSENDDTEYRNAQQDYMNELGKIRANQYGMDLNTQQAKVMDFYG